MRGEYFLNGPDNITRIHFKGDVPSDIEDLFGSAPDRELSGAFFTSIGLDKPGKELSVFGKNIQLILIDCQSSECEKTFSDATVLFVRLNDSKSFNKINDTFNLSQTVDESHKHKQTVIGLLDEPLAVNQEERDQLIANENINYHEIISGDIKSLEGILIGIIENSLSLPQFLLKIACLGTQKKTAIIHDFTGKKLTDNYLPSLGVDINNKRINIHGLQVDLIIVDTAEQEFFGKLRPSYYRGASGGLIFFDFDNRKSFNAIKNWHNEFSSNVNNSIPIALIGIEGEKPKIPLNEAQELAQEYKMDFYKLKKDQNTLNKITEKITETILSI